MARSLALLAALLAVAAPAQAAPGGKPRKDTAAPTVTIAAPAPGATVSGTATVSGSATDNVGVKRVDVSLDGGAYAIASGTGSWTAPLDTTAHADGGHQIAVRATDAAGNARVTTVSVTFSNPQEPPPPPPPPADTTAPDLVISAPAAGATVAGVVTVAGSAADAGSVSRVEVAVDGGSLRLASGTSNWSTSVDTRTYADGPHTITARATDAAGNVATASRSVAFSNGAPLPDGVIDQMTTPEGAVIQIYSGVTGWTAQRIYDLLRPNALQLDVLGPALKVKVQTTNPSSTATSVSSTGGVYSGFRATIYLRASSTSTFTTAPSYIMAHEYGHAWSEYHLYMSQGGDWSSWLSHRGLLGDPRLESTYNWSKGEMIADDYRLLFGTPEAVSAANHLNADIADPRTVAGLRDFFTGTWARP